MSSFEMSGEWRNLLKSYINKKSFRDLMLFLDEEYSEHRVYPDRENVFHAFERTPFENVKIVILGQDPYHNPGQAHGLSFSVQSGVKTPPSLKNIYKEIESDTGVKKDFSLGDLTSWAEQGVLLLNSVLTVRENDPGSHAKKGWEEFSDAVIKNISDKKENVVFILWGNYAKKKGSVIDREKHLVLESGHPSPLSAYRGFFGCKHFSKANDYLNKNGKEKILW